MWSNTRFLVIFSLAAIFTGLGFLWFGLNSSVPISTPLSASVAPSAPGATFSTTQGVEGESVLVTRVVDGDTIEISTGQTVRLIGVDTPETVDPRRPVGCFGKEASNETKKLLTGKEVILQKDVSETDKFHRLLRYIFLPLESNQTLFVNDYLVREGFAKVYAYPPDVKYNEQFRQAEKEAREGNKGLWGRCQ